MNEMDQILLTGPPNGACEARKVHPIVLGEVTRMSDDVPREKASVVFKDIAGFSFNKPAAEFAVGERLLGGVSRNDVSHHHDERLSPQTVIPHSNDCAQFRSRSVSKHGENKVDAARLCEVGGVRGRQIAVSLNTFIAYQQV